MKNKPMLGLWRFLIHVPPSLMEKQMAKAKKKFEAECSFVTQEHRRVHHTVVRELPVVGGPLSAEAVAEKLAMPVGRVHVILDDLERGMAFVVRNAQREVVWAFPVTAEKTPHQLTFSSGERIYAA